MNQFVYPKDIQVSSFGSLEIFSVSDLTYIFQKDHFEHPVK